MAFTLKIIHEIDSQTNTFTKLISSKISNTTLLLQGYKLSVLISLLSFKESCNKLQGTQAAKADRYWMIA